MVHASYILQAPYCHYFTFHGLKEQINQGDMFSFYISIILHCIEEFSCVTKYKIHKALSEVKLLHDLLWVINAEFDVLWKMVESQHNSKIESHWQNWLLLVVAALLLWVAATYAGSLTLLNYYQCWQYPMLIVVMWNLKYNDTRLFITNLLRELTSIIITIVYASIYMILSSFTRYTGSKHSSWCKNGLCTE